jgi:integrase/recombinase XerD
MSDLREAMEQYLAIRRGLGFALREPEHILDKFIAFAEREHASFITTDLVLRWVDEPTSSASLVTKASWVSMIRCFATWRSASDPRTQIPPHGLLPGRFVRQRPYIYTDDEIERIIRKASRLPSRRGIRALTYSTFFALLATTGMRMSEAISLDDADVDHDKGILTIHQTKFKKSRLVPIHASTSEALRQYQDDKRRILGTSDCPALFISEKGTRIGDCATRYNFALVSQQIGLRKPPGEHRHGKGPRLHDMRHRFAVRTLIDWYRAGLDVEREIPKLATYLGHAHVNDTYWYIEAVPELLQLATERLTRRGDER